MKDQTKHTIFDNTKPIEIKTSISDFLTSDKFLKFLKKIDLSDERMCYASLNYVIKNLSRSQSNKEKKIIEAVSNGKINFFFYGVEFAELDKIKLNGLEKNKIEVLLILSLLMKKDIPAYKAISLIIKLFKVDPNLFDPDNTAAIKSKMRDVATKNKNSLKNLRLYFYQNNKILFKQISLRAAFNKLERISSPEYKFLKRITNKKNKSKDSPILIRDFKNKKDLRFGFSTFKKELKANGFKKE